MQFFFLKPDFKWITFEIYESDKTKLIHFQQTSFVPFTGIKNIFLKIFLKVKKNGNFTQSLGKHEYHKKYEEKFLPNSEIFSKEFSYELV